MQPRKSSTGRRRRRTAAMSPEHKNLSFTSINPLSSLQNNHGDHFTENVHAFLTDLLFEDHSNGGSEGSANPRSFPYSVKQQCWEKADKVKGRDPDRWRRDLLGNIIFRKLVGCAGCLCHDYDHIVPYSKGGKSTLENCQVLQATANRSKGNKTEISKSDLIQKSAYCRVSGRDLDVIELSAYGNIRRAQDSGGCNIQ